MENGKLKMENWGTGTIAPSATTGIMAFLTSNIRPTDYWVTNNPTACAGGGTCRSILFALTRSYV